MEAERPHGQTCWIWATVVRYGFRRAKWGVTGSTRPSPRLLDEVRARMRVRHYSLRTEQAYVGWIRRFIIANGKRHPRDLGGREVEAFLTRLATRGMVAAGTQNQALSALLFLYREVLQQDLPWMSDIVRAKRPRRLPVVLTRDEVHRLLAQLEGRDWLMASLLYGAGMRLMECLRLRVKDVDFQRHDIIVREGKGNKDRHVPLPRKLVTALGGQLGSTRPTRGRPRIRVRRGVLAACTGPQIPLRCTRMGMAIRIPCYAALARPAHWHRTSSSPGRKNPATCSTARAQGSRNRQTRHLSYAASLVRDAPDRRRLRHQDRAGAAGPQRRQDDANLHARVESRRA